MMRTCKCCGQLTHPRPPAITPRQADVLATMERRRIYTSSQLADMLYCTRRAVQHHLQALEQAGYVYRPRGFYGGYQKIVARPSP